MINLSAARTGTEASDNITSASYNWVPTEPLRFLWGLPKLHCNDLHCIVPTLSVTQSVFWICSCIQLHKYACNVSQVWHFFACSSTVNIWEPAFYITLTWLLAVAWVGLPSYQISNAIFDSKSFNTSLIQLTISSKNERVFIRDLSKLTWHIIFNAWWSSMDVGLKCPIGWNYSGHVSLWRFQMPRGIEETGHPAIICIICHQVLCHPSEYETSSMAKHCLAIAQITKLKQ